MWQVYYCNELPPGVSHPWMLLKPFPWKYETRFLWVWITFKSPWSACISASTPPANESLSTALTVTSIYLAIICSRCPPPAAPLQISPAQISNSTLQLFYLRLIHARLQDNSFSKLQMESGCFSVLLAGTVPALAASLAVVAVFQLAGALLACCLARYSSLQIQRMYHPHSLQDGCHWEEGMVWA